MDLDDAFFNRTGLERIGVVGPEPGLLWTGLKALDRRVGDRTAAWRVCRLWILLCKDKKESKGRQGLRS